MAGVNPLFAGLACRCPNCGKDPLFGGFLAVRDRCETCGFDLSKADSGDGPVVFILLVVGAIACFGALMVEASFRPPIWVHLVTWLPLSGLLALGLLRPFKSLLIALQVHNRACEARHDG